MRHFQRNFVMPIRAIIVFAAIFAFRNGAQAVEVELFGLTVDRVDFISCDFISGRGRHATIDMGYAHGVVVGNRFWVFRETVDGQRRICDFKIIRVNRKTAVGTATLDVDLKRGDRFVISAIDLDLWRGRKPENQQVFTKIVRQNVLGKYDTRDSAQDGEDLLEVVHEGSLRFRDWQDKLRRFRLQDRLFIDLSMLRETFRNRNAASPLDYQLDLKLRRVNFIVPIAENFSPKQPAASEVIPVLRTVLGEIADLQRPEGLVGEAEVPAEAPETP